MQRMDNINYGVAAGVLSSTTWFPTLAEYNEYGAAAVLTVTFVWVVTQIYYKIKNKGK